MLNVARNIAQDLYTLEEILENMSIPVSEFMKFKDHPRFHQYIREEKAQWAAATNAAQRTKIKAGIVLERFMEKIDSDLYKDIIPLNQRIEGAKLLAKITGLGEPKNPATAGGGGFQLQINIGKGGEGVTINASRVVQPEEQDEVLTIEDDNYDPFSSPDTLGDV